MIFIRSGNTFATSKIINQTHHSVPRVKYYQSSFFLPADIMVITIPMSTTHTTAKIAIITVPFPHETKGKIIFEIIMY